MNNYFIVTPCRNEEKNIPNLAQSILLQSIKPILWVIVDDNSTDNSNSIISSLEKKYDWIKGVYLKEQSEYMGAHYSEVCNKGFNYAIDWCNKNNLSYQYIALLDSDNIPESKYFEKLTDEFESDPGLGIASGINATVNIEKVLLHWSINEIIAEKFLDVWNSNLVKVHNEGFNFPMGSARLWKKECFIQTEGYLFTKSPDSVSNIKAKSHGWKTKRFKNIGVIEREGLIADDISKVFKQRGETDFYLWYPFIFSIMRFFRFLIKKPSGGLFYIYGYMMFWFKNIRIDDDDVKNYNKNNRITDVYKKLLKRVI